jgi:hypothetical protein
MTGDAQSRVSVSLGCQSCADAESDHRMTPTSLWGQVSSGHPSKWARMPECDMEQESLQGSVPLGCEHSPTQRRRHQLSSMRPDELCSLRQDANEVQGQEVGLVYDLLEPQQLSLVIPRRFDDPAHLLRPPHGTGCRSPSASVHLPSLLVEAGAAHWPVTADPEISALARSGSRRIAWLLVDGS